MQQMRGRDTANDGGGKCWYVRDLWPHRWSDSLAALLEFYLDLFSLALFADGIRYLGVISASVELEFWFGRADSALVSEL
jgi:hypothetical protein